LFAALPLDVKRKTLDALSLWEQNPNHPGLEFKKLKGFADLFSLRVGVGWRVIGYLEDGTVFWNWVGSHADYDKYLKRR